MLATPPSGGKRKRSGDTPPARQAKKSRGENPEESKYKVNFEQQKIGGSVIFCQKNQKRFQLEKLYGPTDAVNTTGTTLGTKQRRGQQPYVRRRNQQMLRQVSQILFNAVKSEVKKEQEIEAMFINDRMVLSANLPASIDLITEKIENAGDTKVVDFLLAQGTDNDPRIIEFRRKLIERTSRRPKADEPDTEQQVRAMLTRMKDLKIQDVFEIIDLDVGSIAHKDVDTSDYLAGDGYKDKILLLRMTGGNQPAEADGGVKLHAEQGLIQLALLASSKRDEIKASKMTICGGKRPCQGCLTALKLMRDLGYGGLEFNERPGMYWSISCETIERLLIHADNNNLTFQGGKAASEYYADLRLAAKKPIDSHVTLNKYKGGAEDQGFNSDSDTDTAHLDPEKIRKQIVIDLDDLKEEMQLCIAMVKAKKSIAADALEKVKHIPDVMTTMIDDLQMTKEILSVSVKKIQSNKRKRGNSKKKMRGYDIELGNIRIQFTKIEDFISEILKIKADFENIVEGLRRAALAEKMDLEESTIS